jgi:hypothetical protein
MTEIALTLRQLLEQAHQLPWDHFIFMFDQRAGKWTLDSPAVLHPPDVFGRQGTEMPESIKRGMKSVIDISDLQGIIDNAREQVPHADVQTLFRAFLYYVKNDAPIDLIDETNNRPE